MGTGSGRPAQNPDNIDCQPVPVPIFSQTLSPLREGYVIDDPHNHAQLAWCLLQLIDSARRLSCTQAARQTAAQWTFDVHYQQMLRIFAEAALRKHAA